MYTLGCIDDNIMHFKDSWKHKDRKPLILHSVKQYVGTYFIILCAVKTTWVIIAGNKSVIRL